MNQMHDYAIFDHDRSRVGRWLGVAAVLLAGGIAQLLSYAQDASGFTAFTKATITTGAAYFGLHFLFNKFLWKLPFFNIPDISGKWLIEGKTLEEDGSTRWDWSAEVGIEQDWKTILIHLKTSKSQSYSYTASISKRHGPVGGWQLNYSYRNEPEINQIHELSAHKGYCEVQLDSALTHGTASYFNSGGRRTFGTMKFSREAIA